MDEQRQTRHTRPRRRTARRVVPWALLSGAVMVAVTPMNAGAASPTPVDALGSCATSAPHLTVQGSGQGSGTPDVLTAVFGFSTTAASSAAALSQNNAKVALALQALSANGLATRDTQTTGLNLSAQYSYPHGVATLTGYQATETITATLRQPSKEGTAIDAVVNATGNAAQIDSLTYSFGDPSAVQDKARTAAVHQAVAHAQAMAAAAGRRLGSVCSLTDNTTPAGGQSNQSVDNLAQTESGAAAVPLAPGTQVESDQVTMVYALVR